MIAFTLYLLFSCIILGLFYWHFSKRAKEIKANLDWYVREASRLVTEKDLANLLRLHQALKQYGEQFCVGRPWFGLYAYYVEAEWIVSGRMHELETEMRTIVQKARKGKLVRIE